MSLASAVLGSPVRSPVRARSIRCHLAALFLGIVFLFLVTVVAIWTAHSRLFIWERTAGLLQSAELEVQHFAYMAVSSRGGTITRVSMQHFELLLQWQ
jgi:hypothetical protein